MTSPDDAPGGVLATLLIVALTLLGMLCPAPLTVAGAGINSDWLRRRIPAARSARGPGDDKRLGS